MSTPTGDSAFLQELEIDVRTELDLAETSQPEEADGVPASECPPDPDAERYEVRLRALLGAVETMQDSGHPRESESGAASSAGQ